MYIFTSIARPHTYTTRNLFKTISNQFIVAAISVVESIYESNLLPMYIFHSAVGCTRN